MNTSPSSPAPVTAAWRFRFPCVGLCLALALGALAPARADILHGPVVSPVTGHPYYLLTQNTWTASETVALGGRLVTLNDPPEGQWLPASNDRAEPLRLA